MPLRLGGLKVDAEEIQEFSVESSNCLKVLFTVPGRLGATPLYPSGAADAFDSNSKESHETMKVAAVSLLIIISALLCATGAQALIDCKAIQDPTARLACFDKPAVPKKPKAALSAPAVVADPDERACTLKAAETLPKIPGLTIKNSRTSKRPTPPNWNSPVPPIKVDVDIFAAGQAETYSYLCITGPSGTAVQRVAD